jgi:hypothetical protein
MLSVLGKERQGFPLKSNGVRKVKNLFYPLLMCRGDEGRRRVLLIAAATLAARKLAEHEGERSTPATVSAIANAVLRAEQILSEIDRRWPVKSA